RTRRTMLVHTGQYPLVHIRTSPTPSWVVIRHCGSNVISQVYQPRAPFVHKVNFSLCYDSRTFEQPNTKKVRYRRWQNRLWRGKVTDIRLCGSSVEQECCFVWQIGNNLP